MSVCMAAMHNHMDIKPLRILVACEFSGVVRRAFRAFGHDAWSCDLLPSDDNSDYHLQCDVLSVLSDRWDMMIAHPPCTYLTVSGNKWMKPEYAKRFPDRLEHRKEAYSFFMQLYQCDIAKVAIENPIGVMSSLFRKPDQVIQPWMFGHGETKATCLWLKGLDPLRPTHIVAGREQRLHKLPPSPDRWKERSKTFPGIATAMAAQWGNPAQLSLAV